MKKTRILLCIGLVLALVRGIAQAPAPDSSGPDRPDTVAFPGPQSVRKQQARAMTRVDSLLAYAYTFLGDRYRRGGTSSKGFDCSGYTMTVFKRFGIRLPHTSAGQGLVGVQVSRNNIKKGDIVLFRGRHRRSRRIGHVGIVISEKGQPVRFIHSSTSEGVRIDRLDYDYYKKRYVKTVRVPELYQ